MDNAAECTGHAKVALTCGDGEEPPHRHSLGRCTALPSVPVLAFDRGACSSAHPASSTAPTCGASATLDADDDGAGGIGGDFAAHSARSPHPTLSDAGSTGSTTSFLRTSADAARAEGAESRATYGWHRTYRSATADADTGGTETDCECPMCLLGGYTLYLFANQRRSSAHVMAARPSPLLAGGAPVSLPALPPIPAPSPRLTAVCPVYAAFGVCPYSIGCYLPHRPDRPPLTRRLRCAEDELHRLRALATRRLDEPLWRCEMCGEEGIDETSVEPVGELYFYRRCPRCSFMCYFPFITYLLENILDEVGDDYQLYKSEVDHYRGALPDEFKVPLSFEAHRIASIVFAWSLVTPHDVRDALEAAYRVLPEMESIVSIGSGAGYVEHVFNRVLHGDAVVLRPEWRPRHGCAAPGSFDAVRVRFRPDRRIHLFAFDELALARTYSVHVSLGGPLSLLSFDCPRVVLLLCWPPFGSMQEEQSSMGFEALEYFTQRDGRVVIYIGDTASTGDWRFHQLLYTHYKLVRDYPVRREVRRWYSQEMGLVFAGNDTIGVYSRRETPIDLPVYRGVPPR